MRSVSHEGGALFEVASFQVENAALLARHAEFNDHISPLYARKEKKYAYGVGDHHAARRQAARRTNFLFSPGTKSAESPCIVAAFVVNSEPHTGGCPSVRVRKGLKGMDLLQKNASIQGGLISNRC